MAWFDANHYAEQEILQMSAIDCQCKPIAGATGAVYQVQTVFDQYNNTHMYDPNFVKVTLGSNYEAWSTLNYDASLGTPRVSMGLHAIF